MLGFLRQQVEGLELVDRNNSGQVGPDGTAMGGEPRRGGKHTRQGGGVEALGKGGVLRKEHLLREHLWRQHGRAERR